MCWLVDSKYRFILLNSKFDASKCLSYNTYPSEYIALFPFVSTFFFSFIFEFGFFFISFFPAFEKLFKSQVWVYYMNVCVLGFEDKNDWRCKKRVSFFYFAILWSLLQLKSIAWWCFFQWKWYWGSSCRLFFYSWISFAFFFFLYPIIRCYTKISYKYSYLLHQFLRFSLFSFTSIRSSHFLAPVDTWCIRFRLGDIVDVKNNLSTYSNCFAIFNGLDARVKTNTLKQNNE